MLEKKCFLLRDGTGRFHPSTSLYSRADGTNVPFLCNSLCQNAPAGPLEPAILPFYNLSSTEGEPFRGAFWLSGAFGITGQLQ